MNPPRPYRVAIVGSGPAGAALATLLASAGTDVALFADERRRDPTVGESLIPSIVPLLRRLGVEDAVAAISQHKPGVSFVWGGMHVAFRFARYADRMTPYAFNVPRPQFEEVLQARAVECGARLIPTRAHLARGPAGGPEVILDDANRQAAGWGSAHPDLLVDASGRARLVTRLLDVPARRGPRDDVAHFAHFVGNAWEQPAGQVMIGRVAGGWSWLIPLRDRLSVGVVLDRRVAAGLGDTPQARLESAIASAADLTETLRPAERVSPVGTYANYQLVTTRGIGTGWAAVGDAFGFVDPMLSPGVSVAIHSAEFLADALAPVLAAHRNGHRAPATETDLRPYARRMTGLLDAWMELVEYLYDGRMLALVQAGLEMVEARGDRLALLIQDKVEMNVALLASGTAITSRYRLGLLRLLGRYGLRGVEP
ncbi:MAG: tryptophan 7-halogenase, partial [Ardenticatenales bacterium]